MFDAFDDDFAEDQSFLCDSQPQSAARNVPKQLLCELTKKKPTHEVSAALNDKDAPFVSKETSAKSKLKKFSFVRKNSTNLTDNTASLCPMDKKVKEVATSIPEHADSNGSDLSVLHGLDFESFDDDGFDFDESISTSTPSNAKPTPNAADYFCDRISIPLAVTQAKTHCISLESSDSRDSKCTKDSVPAISNASKFMNNKDIASRTDRNLENSEVEIATNKILHTKRKFPGPAGLLPKFSRLPDPNQLFKGDVNLLNNGSNNKSPKTVTESQFPSNMEVSCSQVFENPFQKAPWLTMMKDLSKDNNGRHLQILEKFNISRVLQQAKNQKALSNLKIPLLCVVIHSIIKADQPDVSAVLKDETGNITGMICQKLIQEFTEQLIPGSVLVLKQLMVMKLSSKRHCLNITPMSVVSIYFEKDKEIVENLTLNSISWGVLLQEGIESPPSPMIGRSSSSNNAVTMSTPVICQSHSKSVLKSGRYNEQTGRNFSNVPMHVPGKPSPLSSSPIPSGDSNNHNDSVIRRNPLKKKLNCFQDSHVQPAPTRLLQRQSPPTTLNMNVPVIESAPKEVLQKSNNKLSDGCDLADDPLWTDDDFESMLLDIDTSSA